jgi:hypothetical protein
MREIVLCINSRGILLWFSLLILILFIAIGCDKPQVTGEESGDIDVSQEPVQIKFTSNEPAVLKIEGDSEFTISPVAEYKVAAVVAGKKRYHDGWRADVAPVDLAIVWGKLAGSEYDKYISYSQHDRWYFYELEDGKHFNGSFVISHSANNHIIPANENIFKAIKTIDEKEKIFLEGFLVNVKGRHKGGNFLWNSSLKRTDTGDGSCEVFYVKRLRIGTKVYE